MRRLVLDTNVLVSAVIAKGKPRELLNMGIGNQFRIVVSDFILKEFAAVLRQPRFKTGEDEIQRALLALMQSGDVIEVKSNFKMVTRDPNDDNILNTAYDGRADSVVTGDRLLLGLGSFKGIRILTVKQAVSELRMGRHLGGRIRET
jgi:putative PIN family toxin of toxin-antitoxin system